MIEIRNALRETFRYGCSIISIGDPISPQIGALAVAEATQGRQVWVQVCALDALQALSDLLQPDSPWGLARDRRPPVSGVVAQRLLRTLCPHCKIPLDDSSAPDQANDILRRIPDECRDVHVRNWNGCDHPECRKGIAGRTAVAETIVPDARLADLVSAGKLDEAARYWNFRRGGISMHEHAAAKAAAGIVDPEEVVRWFGPFDALSDDQISRVIEASIEYLKKAS